MEKNTKQSSNKYQYRTSRLLGLSKPKCIMQNLLSSQDSSSPSLALPTHSRHSLPNRSSLSQFASRIWKSISGIRLIHKNIENQSLSVLSLDQDQIVRFYNNCLLASIDHNQSLKKKLQPFEIVTVGKY